MEGEVSLEGWIEAVALLVVCLREGLKVEWFPDDDVGGAIREDGFTESDFVQIVEDMAAAGGAVGLAVAMGGVCFTG